MQADQKNFKSDIHCFSRWFLNNLYVVNTYRRTFLAIISSVSSCSTPLPYKSSKSFVPDVDTNVKI